MVLFNYSTKELTAKIVYYGPGLCGKTTNLQYIHQSLPETVKGKMLSLATKTDRTLFFDFLPIDLGDIRGMKTRVQLYTVPGQVFYNETRKLVLKGADGIVFVADSQKQMLSANVESFKNLEENLKAHGLTLAEMPHVIQFNKRDLEKISSIEEMNAAINHYNAPFYESVATTGIGVHDTLKAISKLVLLHLTRKYDPMAAAAQPEPAQPPAAPTPSVQSPPPAQPAASIPLAQPAAPAPSIPVAAQSPPTPSPSMTQAIPLDSLDLGGAGDASAVSSLVDDIAGSAPPAPPAGPSAPAGFDAAAMEAVAEAEAAVIDRVAPADQSIEVLDVDAEPEIEWQSDSSVLPEEQIGDDAMPTFELDDDAGAIDMAPPTPAAPAGAATSAVDGTVELTEVVDDNELFDDPSLEVARMTRGEEREIVIPIELQEGQTQRRFKLSLRLKLDPVGE